MSKKAAIYAYALIACGALVMSSALFSFHSADLLRFVTFFVLTAGMSSFKVRLPLIFGTLSVSAVFIFFAIIQLTLPEMLLLAAGSAFIQTLWKPVVRPKAIHVFFNVSSITVSAFLAEAAFHLWPVHSPLILKLGTVASVYFIANTSSVSAIVALTSGRKFVEIWRNCYFWSYTYYLVGSAIAASMQFATNSYGWEFALAVVPLLFVIYRSYQLYLDRLQKEKEHAEGLASLHMRTIEALAMAIEAKDHSAGEHVGRIQVYAREIAKDLQLSDEDCLALEAAAILHDIGKLAVPDYIISKPGKLTPEEFDKMKIHPVVGAEILERIKFPYPVVPIVKAHHEKWDGSGYPFGLRGEEIPIGARILTAVDCLDALTSDRQYRKALPLDDAMRSLSNESGKSFDPCVIEVLERRYRELEELACGTAHLETVAVSTGKRNGAQSPDVGFQSPGKSESRREAESDFLTSIASARQEAQLLFEFTQDLGNSLSLKETLSVIATRISRLVAHDAVAIYIKEGGYLVPIFVHGENQKLFESLRIPVGEGLSGWVAENNKPILNGNPSVEPGYLNDETKFSNLRSGLVLPMHTESGSIGVIGLYRAAKDAFTRDDLRILLALVSKISVAVENSLSYQEANTKARVDGLTGLPNATALFLHLESEMARSSKQSSSVAVLVTDLDGFKRINDTRGHLVGNELLKGVAQAFQDCCRDSDYVGRMGGDEFVFVLPGVNATVAAAKIEQIERAVRLVAAGMQSTVSVSVGCSIYPEDGTEAETLLAEADRRMYGSKRRRKNSDPERDITRDLANLKSSLSLAGMPAELQHGNQDISRDFWPTRQFSLMDGTREPSAPPLSRSRPVFPEEFRDPG